MPENHRCEVSATGGRAPSCWTQKQPFLKGRSLWAFHTVQKLTGCVAAILLIASWTAAWAQAAPAPADAKSSLIAIGDVHGDFDDLVAILQRVGVVDAQHHWTGGKTTLVQLGDLLDEGPKVREVMDLLMSLEKEAPKAGGQVVVLLGNHEVMNIMGDLRYVTQANYASFANADSEGRRSAAYAQYLKWHKDHARLLAQLSPDIFPEQSQAEWMARHPAGFIERREAFGPNGIYGKWIREHAAVAKIGNSIFLHGGIHPRLASMKLDAINTRVRDEIRVYDRIMRDLVDEKLILPFFTQEEITAVARAQLLSQSGGGNAGQIKELQAFLENGSWLIVNSYGPLWFRGYAQWSDEEATAAIDTLLQAYGAAHFVVGHTPQQDGRIRARFGGKVFLIDTGMLHSYYPFGRASALEIQDQSKFTAQYIDGHNLLAGASVVFFKGA